MMNENKKSNEISEIVKNNVKKFQLFTFYKDKMTLIFLK